MKKACGTWLAVYVVLAIAIGLITYRRYPAGETALGAAIVGGGVTWLGVAYLVGIGQKLKARALIRRGLNGEPPRDGDKYAAIGRIAPAGPLLTSPLSKTPCVAYKYEIKEWGSRTEDMTYYDGFAQTPSVIQTGAQSVRLLAWGDLKLSFKTIPVEEAKPNAEEYIAKTEFRDPAVLNFRKSLADLNAIYQDDDGGVRWDVRGLQPPLNTGEPFDLDRAQYHEWLVRPGDHVCVIGRYSAQRGGIVPSDSPMMDQVTIEVGEREAFTKRAAAGAFGYLFGGALLLGAAAAALVVFLALVPLEQSEQMTPGLVASWPEIRLERLLDKRVRPYFSRSGMLDHAELTILLAPGTANGRVKAPGRSEVATRATAQRNNGRTTVTINDGLIVLQIDEQTRRATQLAIGGQTIAPADADVHIAELGTEVAGRVTYLPDTGSTAARVTFRARP